MLKIIIGNLIPKCPPVVGQNILVEGDVDVTIPPVLVKPFVCKPKLCVPEDMIPK